MQSTTMRKIVAPSFLVLLFLLIVNVEGSSSGSNSGITTTTRRTTFWGIQRGGGSLSFATRKKEDKYENSTGTNKDNNNINSNNNMTDTPPPPPPTTTTTTTTQSKKKIDQIKVEDDKWRFSLYQEDDGSSEDPDGIPTRFLKMQKNNRRMAKVALNETLAWREKENVDTILCRPHPQFDACKAIVPHFFAGADQGNHLVFVQQPALIDLPKATENGVELDDLIMHYVYVLEYCWNILAFESEDADGDRRDENGAQKNYRYEKTMTSVMDMTGLHIGILRKRKMLNFAGKFVTMMSTHYPQRSHKMLLLNVPKWFDMFYKVFSPLLRESSKAKMRIYSHGKQQEKALLKLLGHDICKTLPQHFFTSSFVTRQREDEEQQQDDKEDEAGESSNTKQRHNNKDSNDKPFSSAELEMEVQLRNFCVARLKEAGAEMQAVV